MANWIPKFSWLTASKKKIPRAGTTDKIYPKEARNPEALAANPQSIPDIKLKITVP